MPSKENKSFLKEWLEKMQQESWQLELLISGFALFGIQKSQGILFTFNEYLTFEYYSPIFKLFHQALVVGWKIFFFNLLIHVIFRGLWIGAIGLRYVSGEIDYDKLNYSNYFTNYLKRSVGNYDDFIERLEKICSVIFSYTFLLFLFFISFLSTLFFLSLPGYFIEMFGYDVRSPLFLAIFTIYAITYVLIGAIVFIDFISLGAFKKIEDPTVSKIYHWIYIFYSLTTFTYFYRPLIYNFIDNKYTKFLFYLSFPYILILMFYSNAFTVNSFPHIPNEEILQKQGLAVNDYWYEDLSQKKIAMSTEMSEEDKLNLQLPTAILSAYNMKDPYASLQLRLYPRDFNYLKTKLGITPIHQQGVTFSLFGEDLKEDSIRENLKAPYIKELMALTKQSRTMRDSIKMNRKSKDKRKQFKQVKDSIRNEFQKVIERKKERLLSYDENKNNRILKGFTSLFEITIDSIDYTDSLHYTFAKSGESYKKSIRGDFPISELEIGPHLLTLKRKYYRTSHTDSIEVKVYQLPFIKQF